MRGFVFGLCIFVVSLNSHGFICHKLFPLPYASNIIPNQYWSSALPQPGAKNIHQKAVEKFFKNGFDLEPRLENFSPSWPLLGRAPALLTRFGTPTVLKFNSSGSVYTHESLDITRLSTSITDKVFSPVSGSATIIYDQGDRSEYSTSVVIWDEESNLLISLLHLRPANFLAHKNFVKISKGDYIGNLAKVESMVDPAKQEEFKHTHLAVIDAAASKLLNPSNMFETYDDSIQPTVKDVQLFDEHGNILPKLFNGKLDMSVVTFDQDNYSGRNFEIANIKANVKDQRGRLLYELKKCNLDFLTSALVNQDIKNAFHLDYIGNFVNADFGFFLTNASVQDREFSYAFTNFQRHSNGECFLVDDKSGFIFIEKEIKSIKVEIEVFDHHGNKTVFEKIISK